MKSTGESQHKGWPIEEKRGVSAAGRTTGQIQTMSKGAWFHPPVAAVPKFVGGYILAKYKAMGGRSGVLGLPTTSEIDIPGTAPGSHMRTNPLQHSAIC